jgi:hypothetical protein
MFNLQASKEPTPDNCRVDILENSELNTEATVYRFAFGRQAENVHAGRTASNLGCGARRIDELEAGAHGRPPKHGIGDVQVLHPELFDAAHPQ